MLDFFDNGEQTKFMNEWSKCIGKNQGMDIYRDKIEFYLMIYFTIFPMHSLNKAKYNEKVSKQRQKEFK